MRRRSRAVLGCVLAATAALAWMGCGSIKDGWEDKAGPPRVVASFPPIDCFVKNVGGDHVGLMCLCTGTGPHDYQFNIRDSIRLKRADLFFANGLNLDDHFADKMVANSGNARLRLGDTYLKLASDLPASLRKKGEAHAHEDGHEGHDHDHGHQHGEFDPHVWLGIPQAIGMVKEIRDALKKVDTAHAADYDKNAKAYIDRLKALHDEGKKRLKGLKAPVITFHESMGYFADSFGLNVIGSIQPTPGIEPSNKKLVEQVKQCAGKPRVLIAVEPQYPKTSADTLKKELLKAHVGRVELVEVDPLETCNADDLAPDWYERKMRDNLDNLAKYAQ